MPIPFLTMITDNAGLRVWENEWLLDYLQRKGLLDKLEKVVVDAGAGDGEYQSISRFWIKEQGFWAYLFDALESNVEKLSRLYKDEKRVHVDTPPVVLSDIDYNKVVFQENPYHWSLSRVSEVAGPDEVLRTTRRLSSLLSSYYIGPVDVGILSIDVEGSDAKILKEMLEADWTPQIIIIEANTCIEQSEQDEIFAAYKSRNYLSEGYKFIGGISPNRIFARESFLGV